MTSAPDLLRWAASGSSAATGQLMTAIEAEDGGTLEAIGRCLRDAPCTPPLRIGVTGPGGAGKSTLIAKLVASWPQPCRPAVLAVDPTSRVTGGALLGDRYRLARGGATGVAFFRSIGSRGGRGGLSRHVALAACALEVCGFSPIFVETAGAGQGDVEAAELVDLLVLVITPESGDHLQVMKSGLMEEAQVCVVNKADRAGAEALGASVRSIVARGRAISVELLSADRLGPSEIEHLARRWEELGTSRQRPRGELWQAAVTSLVHDRLASMVLDEIGSSAEAVTAISRCSAGELSLEAAVREIRAGL